MQDEKQPSELLEDETADFEAKSLTELMLLARWQRLAAEIEDVYDFTRTMARVSRAGRPHNQQYWPERKRRNSKSKFTLTGVDNVASSSGGGLGGSSEAYDRKALRRQSRNCPLLTI